MAKFRLEMARVVASLRHHPYPTVRDAFVKMAEEDPELARLVAPLGGAAAVMERLFLVFRDALAANNADKAYYLNKLREHNDIAEQMSDYLSDMVEASAGLNGGNKSPYMCLKPGDLMSWRPISTNQLPLVLPPPRGATR